MDKAKPLYVFGITVIWTLAAVTALVNDSGCTSAYTSVENQNFTVRFDPKEIFSVEVECQDNATWANFGALRVNCSRAVVNKISFDFNNCPYPQNFSLLDTLNLMNVDLSGDINFQNLRFLPSRQYFRNVSARELLFLESNLDVFELPFDLFYDVLDLRNLTIHNINLLRIPKNFFKGWSGNLQRLDIMYTKLQKIAKDDFADLVELRELLLFENKITEIEAGAFDHLSNLVTLEISNNFLHTLPSGIFRYLAKLTGLYIRHNPFDKLPSDLLTGIDNSHLADYRMDENRGLLKTLPAGFFKNIASLKKLSLQDAQLESLPSDLFSGTLELGIINLRNNSLRSIPLGLFNECKKLDTLNLANNQIATLPDGIFETLARLNSLDISHNDLTALTPDILSGLNVLKTLKASHNHLNRVDEQICDKIKSVQNIDFSFNRLTFQPIGKDPQIKDQSIFMTCVNLHDVNLSHNRARKIFDFKSIKDSIDLSDNNLTELTVSDIELFYPLGLTVNLQNNQISKINLTDLPGAVARYKTQNKSIPRNLTVMLRNNPIHCDCHLIDFVRYWKLEHNSELRQFVRLTGDNRNELVGSIFCASPAEFENRNISSIDPNELRCSLKTDVINDACNNTCTCYEYPARQSLLVDCSYKNLTKLPTVITNVHNWPIELDMSYNLLKESPSLISNPYFANVSILDLSNNNISSVTIDLFSKNLQVLRLHNNSISRLDEEVIEYLRGKKSVSLITLHQNPWQCDCGAHKFLNFIQEKVSIYGLNEVACYGTKTRLHEMTLRYICKDAIAIIVGASLLVALFGIAIGILAALYYKYQQEIKVWLYSKQWCLWFVTEDELDKDKKYDAFVSFSHKDEDFVEKEIVAKLEDGPRPYKLCLHYRDWLAGEWIPVQISQSVEESRRTIVVLSPNFLESVWGRMEFRAAHTQALKEGRARVIIILYGEIEKMDDLEPELKAYLSLNTYIKWGDPWFWDKLRYALPHRFEQSRRKTRDARIMEDHLLRRTANNGPGDAIVKSDVISMSKLANDSAKLLEPCLDDRMTASADISVLEL